MGVLMCQRLGCTNIMCTRYSFKFGYICTNCFNELVELCRWTDRDIRKFLDTEKDSLYTTVREKEIAKEYLNTVFPIRAVEGE